MDPQKKDADCETVSKKVISDQKKPLKTAKVKGAARSQPKKVEDASPGSQPKDARREAGRADEKFYAVCIDFDVCFKDSIPTLYKIYADFSELINASKDVKIRNRRAINIKTFKKGVVGNQESDGGVITGVKGEEGCVYARSFSSRVLVSGANTFGYHDFVEMNCKQGIPKGNCIGVLMWLSVEPLSGNKGSAPYAVFCSETKTLKYYDGSGKAPTVFKAHNNTVANRRYPKAPPGVMIPGGGGSMPPGWHRIGGTTNTGSLDTIEPSGRGGVNGRFGKGGKIPVDINGDYHASDSPGVDCSDNATAAKRKNLPSYLQPQGVADGVTVCKRDDLAIHPGRANISNFEDRYTNGCIRVEEDAMSTMKEGGIPRVIKVE
jgi:hypothetical protein